jgi:hypothetical protein
MEHANSVGSDRFLCERAGLPRLLQAELLQERWRQIFGVDGGHGGTLEKRKWAILGPGSMI